MSSLASDLFSPSRLIAHLRSPLYRNGYALVLSTITTSGMGVLYWILAARSYSAEVVGFNSAIISTMSFIALVSQLGLGDVLNRFIPRAGKFTRRFILASYAISLLMTLIVSLIFLLGLDLWAPAMDILHDTPLVSIWFVLATLCWCIFALEDGALVGLRQAIWVPIENAAYGVIKILLIVALASTFSNFGVFASWTFPLIFLIIPVNILIFYFLIPRHTQATAQDSETLTLPHLVRYVSGDYFSSLIWIATISIMPIMIVDRAGAAANAYYYLPWTIAYSLYLVSRNMGMSFIAEAVSDQGMMEQYSYRTLAQTWKLLLLAVVVVVVGAPFILRLFGPEYALQGTTLLRLLALSALPYLLITQFISMARVQRRVGTILITLAILCTLVMTLSYILLGKYGITGIGAAWLFCLTLVALVLAATELRSVLISNINFKLILAVLAQPRHLWWNWQNRLWLSRNRGTIPSVLHMLPEEEAETRMQPAQWEVKRFIPSSSAMRLITLGPPQSPPCAILNLPESHEALQICRRQSSVLNALQGESRLGEWRTFLPRVLAEGEIKNRNFLLMDLLPGTEAAQVISNPAARQPILLAAAAVIQEMHRRTCRTVSVGTELMKTWIDTPLQAFQHLGPSWLDEAGHREALDRLSSTLHHALADKTLTVSWIHGDYWPANILVSPEGQRVTGIVDWDLARPDDLPFLDLLNLLLATRVQLQQRELGDILQELLVSQDWAPAECEILNAAPNSMPGGDLSMRDMLLLYWLRHSAANLNKSARYARHPLWVTRNVNAVLRRCL